MNVKCIVCWNWNTIRMDLNITQSRNHNLFYCDD